MFAKIQIPPGLDRRGTEYQSQARFWAADLVRWFQGRLQPIGGWSQIGTALTGTARAIHAWVDNSAVGRAAIGTESNLYTLGVDGALTDITPLTGYTAQAVSSTWTIDNAFALLVAVNDADGTIFTWSAGDTAAATLINAPSANSVVVTNEGIIMALGSAGNPRQISWCDRDDYTDWSAGFADLAGDLTVQAKAGIQCGHNIRAGTLLWTSEDLHIARYLGQPNIYGVERVADDCGAISRGCVALVDDMSFWMGNSSFYACNGGAFVEEMLCPVHDDVFGKLDRDNANNVRAVHVSEFNEIWWMYPSTDDAGTDNSRVVVYNYLEKHWSLHALARDCGLGRGAGFAQPLLIAGDTIYKHETGVTMTGAGTPYARSGPVELGDGSRVLHARRCIPDEKACGDVELYFHTRLFPNGDETSHGPFEASNPINLRFTGRQAAIEFRQAAANAWRVGDYRVELKAGGMR